MDPALSQSENSRPQVRSFARSCFYKQELLAIIKICLFMIMNYKHTVKSQSRWQPSVLLEASIAWVQRCCCEALETISPLVSDIEKVHNISVRMHIINFNILKHDHVKSAVWTYKCFRSPP